MMYLIDDIDDKCESIAIEIAFYWGSMTFLSYSSGWLTDDRGILSITDEIDPGDSRAPLKFCCPKIRNLDV